MLNIDKLESRIESSKITKAQLCSRAHIDQSALDAVLSGGDARISTIEAIAQELHINIGFLFDEEEKAEIREAARDYVERGKILHKGGESNIDRDTRVSALEQENAELKRRLIAAQERIISLLEDKK